MVEVEGGGFSEVGREGREEGKRGEGYWRVEEGVLCTVGGHSEARICAMSYDGKV